MWGRRLRSAPGARRLPRGQLYTSPWRTVEAVLRPKPGDLDHGPACAELRHHAATQLGTRHAALLPHARVAFACLLKGLDLRPGSEVLLTPVTLPDLVNVILDAGLIPRWVDLAPRTGQIDVGDLAAKIRPRCKALLLTHLCGLVPDMAAVTRLTERHGIALLEDTSQAMGATFAGRQLGTFGRAGFFSLTTLKPVSSYLGGLVITDDADLAADLQAQANALPAPPRAAFRQRLARDLLLHAASAPRGYDVAGHEVMRVAEAVSPRAVAQLQRGRLPGLPGGELGARRRRLPRWMWTRYTDLQARLALESWSRFDADLRQRQRLGAHLLRRLQGTPGAPVVQPDTAPAWWRFPYWSPDPRAFRAALRRRGVDTAQTNLRATHREAAFRSFAARPSPVTQANDAAPEAARFVDEVVFLPLHPNLTCADMDHVADAVLAYERARA